MFELTLSIAYDKQKYLNKLAKKLAKDCGDIIEVVVCQNFGGRCHLALSVKDSKKEYLKAKVLDGVLEIIVSEYKYNYFKEMLSSSLQNIMVRPFLKAITIFDADSDYEIIKKEINLSGEVLIDSFYHFKLQGLKQRWEKTAAIILKNGISSSESSMIQVIKYLIESSENLTLIANVKVSDEWLQIKNFRGSKRFKASEEGLSKFLTELISLNPLKINLTKDFDDEQNNKPCEILGEIFGEKIYLQN